MAGDRAAIANRAHLARAGITRIPTGWEVIQVQDILADDRGISVGVMYPGDHDPTGVPLIKAGDLSGSLINPRPDFRISPEKHREYRRTELSGGEILLTLVGDIGHSAVVPPAMAGWNAARAIAVIRLADPTDAAFLRLCFLSKPIRHLMDVWANTTVQPTLNLKEIRQLPLPWPPKRLRGRIAQILGALDDKIELNRRMNETLEAMARALFKSWFVDFDPVRAKLEGRQPAGMDAATAALFPDSFQDSPLGKIPKGWEIGILEDFLLLQRGFDLPTDDRAPGPFRVLSAGGPHGFHNQAPVKGPSVVTGRSGVLGKVFLVLEPFWPLNTVLWVKEFRRSRPVHGYQLLQTLDFSTYNAGSAVPTLNRNHVHNIPLVLPPQSVINRYESIALPLYAFCRRDELESEALAALRDALLPKLLSGAIRVAEAERFVETPR